MTRYTTGSRQATDEFRDVARDALKLGGRCVGAARDWLGEKREEFTAGRTAGAAAGTAGAAAAGVTVHGYRGIGPRGYRRDDTRVREDVCDALTENDAIDASNITVSVQEGVVRLAGTVPHRMMKRLAEDVSEGCPGVRDVDNQLRVGMSQTAPGTSNEVPGVDPLV